MEYAIAICDDSDVDRRSVAGMVRRWAEAAGCSVRIGEFSSAEGFLFEYDRKKDYDILLLDVEMREVSGIELAKRVRAQGGGRRSCSSPPTLSSSPRGTRWTPCTTS